MPIYVYRCSVCGVESDVLQSIGADAPLCCGIHMTRVPTHQAMIKMSGMGGYPSRRKQTHGSAPYTTSATKPWGSYDPNNPQFLESAAQKRQARIEELLIEGR